MFFQKIPEIFRRKGEYKLKIKRRPLSLDEGETKVPKLPPVGIVPCGLLVEEVFVKEPIQGKSVEGRDFAFDKGEVIEGVLE